MEATSPAGPQPLLPEGTVHCPHCDTVVVPTRDGTCPACRRVLAELPTAIGLSAGPPQTDDTSPASPAPPAPEPGSHAQALTALAEAERPLIQGRGDVVRDVELERPVDPLIADRCEELAARCRQSADVGPDAALTGVPLYFRIRAECWSSLAAAVRGGGPDEAARHNDLWERSERLRVSFGGEAVRRFRAGLSAITPRPWVMRALIAANAAVYAVMLAAGAGLSPTVEHALAWGADYGPRTLSGEWWRLLSSVFVHFGPLHLAFNMWALWGAGSLLERLVGSAGFSALYVLAGLSGGVASLAWNPSIISAGASGAVFGVFGGLAAVLLRQRAAIPAAVLKALRGSAAGFVLYNVLFGLMTEGIDNAAHLGGLVAGFACGLLLAHPLTTEGARGRPARAAVTAAAGAAVLAAAGLLLPAAPVDVFAELSQLAAAETRILAEYNGLVGRAQDGRLSDPQLADALEESILPEWRAERRRLQSLRGSRGADPAGISRMDEYMSLRERSWETLAEAARGGDRELLARHRRLWEEAENAARVLLNGR